MGGCSSSDGKKKKNKKGGFTLDNNEDANAFKIVLLGDISVGKTSLLWRFTNSRFLESHTPTVGLAFSQHKIDLDSKVRSVLIED